MSSDQKNPWKTLAIREIYENRWIKVDEHQVINPSGGPGIYGKVHFKNKAVGVLAVDRDDHTWLVGQWRYTLDEWSWEIPEGGGAPAEDPLEAARRELREETGMSAASWKLIQRVHLSNSVSDEEGFIYLAEDLTQGKNELDDTEADLKTWRLPLREAVKMVDEGKITDSLSVMALLYIARTRGW